MKKKEKREACGVHGGWGKVLSAENCHPGVCLAKMGACCWLTVSAVKRTFTLF